MAPCKHRLYKTGDSWCEELGISKWDLSMILKKIGTKVTRGTNFDKVFARSMKLFKEYKTDKTKLNEARKYLIIYRKDDDNITWWYLNIYLLADMVKDVYQETRLLTGTKLRNLISRNEGTRFPLLTETTTENNENADFGKSESVSSFCSAGSIPLPCPEPRSADGDSTNRKKIQAYPWGIYRDRVQSEYLRGIIDCFIGKYEEERGQRHPNYKADQWEKCIESIRRFDEKENVEAEYWQNMINEYFRTDYSDYGADYRLMHFCSNGVLERKLYDSM